MGETESFNRWLAKQEEKGRDPLTTLAKQENLLKFRRDYGATTHVPKTYCPVCGSKQLYSTLGTAEEGPKLVCRECKSLVTVVIHLKGEIPKPTMVISSSMEEIPPEGDDLLSHMESDGEED